MSMVRVVVRAVRAESALEKADATMPIVNSIATVSPNVPVAASPGSRLSARSGTGIPWAEEYMSRRTPRERQMRFAGTNAKE